MSNTALAPMLKEQKEALSSLSDELRSVHDKIVAEVSNMSTNEVISRYNIGEWAKDVTNNERRYGEGAISKLSLSLGGAVSETALTAYRRFATVYTREQVTKLLERTMPGGGRITYSHFAALSSLTDDREKVRKQLEKAIFTEGITSTDINARVLAAVGNRRGKGGRRIVPPKSIGAALRQMEKFSRDVSIRADSWDKAVFHKVEEAGPDECDRDLLKQLKAGREKQVELFGTSQLLVNKFDEAIQRVETVLSSATSNGHATAKKKTVKKGGRTEGTAKKKSVNRVAGATPVKKKKKKKSLSEKIATARNKARSGRPVPA